MKPHLSLVILLLSISSFAQNNPRLESAVERITTSEPFVPDSLVLSNEQKALLRKRHDQKIKAETTLLNNNYILTTSYMTHLVDSIVERIKSANPNIPRYTEAFIYKSTAFNAFTMGEDILFINADLVYECKNVHELAMVIAHEIAHNTLEHSLQHQIKEIQFITNDSIQRELRTAAKQEYGQVTALNSLLLPRILDDQAVSRQHELDADSLGMSYIVAAGFNANLAVNVFDIMKYHSDAPKGTMDYTPLPEAMRTQLLAKEKYYTRENSLGFNQKIETEWDPYLRSHPYSDERREKLTQAFSLTPIEEESLKIDTNSRLNLYQEMSAIAFELGALTKYQYITIENFSLSRTVQDKLAFGFYALGFLKERFVSGKYLELQNLAQPEDYDRLCYALNNCSSSNFYSLANLIKPNYTLTSPELSQEETIMSIIDLVKADDKGTLEIVWNLNIKDLKSSPYGWFMYHIEDYLYTAKRYIFVKQVK